jgi:hypothetical protein
MPKTKLEKYVIIYESQEHYEVLAYIEANNIKDAIEKARRELKKEVKRYDVEKAKIARIGDEKDIEFDIDNNQ